MTLERRRGHTLTGAPVQLELDGPISLRRSGLGVRYGIVPSNCVGVIDSDYRGEILVGLRNQSQEAFVIEPGMRVAQMVILARWRRRRFWNEALMARSAAQAALGLTGC